MSGGRRDVPSAWLARLCGICPRLHPVECVCGLWTVEDRDKVEWTRWDAGVLTGDDVAVAVVLGRRLLRLRRVGSAVGVAFPFGWRGLDGRGEYLAAHVCGRAPVGSRPFERVEPVAREDLSWLPETRSPPDATDPWAGVQVGLF